jgi:transcriptional regulator with XRE-family HTH domain
MPRKVHRATFIRQWRLYRNLTQERLADRLGMTAGNLSQLERGIVGYTQPVMEAVADALGCTVADLLIRDPSDPEGIWSVWEALTPSERHRAVTILQALKRAG